MAHPEADPPPPRSHPYPAASGSAPPSRLAGRQRADGLAAPTRRYLAIVALLAGAASLPLIAAVAGPGAVGSTALGDVSPFLAPPSGGPVTVPPPPAPGLGDPAAVVPRGAALPVVPFRAVVPLPAILKAAGRSVGEPVRVPVAAGTGVARPDPGTGPAALPPEPTPAKGPEPTPGKGEVAGPPPTEGGDRPPKAKGEGMEKDRWDAPPRGGKACPPGPKADQDRKVGAGWARDVRGRPTGRATPPGRDWRSGDR